ncbi:MerR, DNA binding [compost metagenome]
MLKIIICLKKTGMSLDEMKPFLDLSSQDDLSSFPELVDMLQSHKDKIRSQIASLQQIVDLIDSKMLRQGIGKQDECTLITEASLRQSTYFNV